MKDDQGFTITTSINGCSFAKLTDTTLTFAPTSLTDLNTQGSINIILTNSRVFKIYTMIINVPNRPPKFTNGLTSF